MCEGEGEGGDIHTTIVVKHGSQHVHWHDMIKLTQIEENVELTMVLCVLSAAVVMMLLLPGKRAVGSIGTCKQGKANTASPTLAIASCAYYCTVGARVASQRDGKQMRESLSFAFLFAVKWAAPDAPPSLPTALLLYCTHSNTITQAYSLPSTYLTNSLLFV